MKEESELYRRTEFLFKNRPHSLDTTTIAKETGLTKAWLDNFVNSKSEPSVVRIEKLYKYLSKRRDKKRSKKVNGGKAMEVIEFNRKKIWYCFNKNQNMFYKCYLEEEKPKEGQSLVLIADKEEHLSVGEFICETLEETYYTVKETYLKQYEKQKEQIELDYKSSIQSIEDCYRNLQTI
jgi:transcriptional regulator with XRE-family HTH domain